VQIGAVRQDRATFFFLHQKVPLDNSSRHYPQHPKDAGRVHKDAPNKRRSELRVLVSPYQRRSPVRRAEPSDWTRQRSIQWSAWLKSRCGMEDALRFFAAPRATRRFKNDACDARRIGFVFLGFFFFLFLLFCFWLPPP
jgi:hypothetical protein